MSIEVSNCHPLKSMCLFLNAVGHHLNVRKFISTTLTEELLPSSTRIVYKSGNEDIVREDALPIIAYRIAGIELQPFQAAYGIGDTGNTAAEMSSAVHFTVSTTNEALTSELALEVGQFCMSMHKVLQSYEMFIAKVTISGTTRGKSGYYDATVDVAASLGRPVWNNSNINSILREIGMQLSLQ